MADIALNLRANEGCAPQPVLFPDLVWNAREGAADFAYADPSETLNRGGLSARAALETAVIICLFTDRRCPPDHPLAKWIEAGDPRGWWGDAVDVRTDLFEQPMGSLLWLLERATATPDTALWAQSLATEALSVLQAQGLVARIDVQTQLRPPSRLDLAVQIYGRDGQKVYDRRFDDVWSQLGQNGTI